MSSWTTGETLVQSSGVHREDRSSEQFMSADGDLKRARSNVWKCFVKY